MDLHSLEVQVVFGSVGLSQDWRRISAWVGSCWTISRLEQVIGRLNETCGDNVVDLSPINQPSSYGRANASCAFKELLGN